MFTLHSEDVAYCRPVSSFRVTVAHVAMLHVVLLAKHYCYKLWIITVVQDLKPLRWPIILYHTPHYLEVATYWLCLFSFHTYCLSQFYLNLFGCAHVQISMSVSVTMEAANTTAMTHMEIIHVPVMMTTSLTAMDKHVKVLYIARTHHYDTCSFTQSNYQDSLQICTVRRTIY